MIYNEFYSNVTDKRTLRLVSAIAPELFISARPDYWYDTDFLRTSLFRDELVNVLAGMTGNTEDFIRGGMSI